MKTLIIYGSKHGCSEKCAIKLSEKLNFKTDVFNVKHKKNIDFKNYDKVIIGGSIYIGNIQKEVKKICLDNIEILKEKKIGLYICSMSDGEKAEELMKTSFPEELISRAIAKECFGGELILNKMNFFERFIIKKVTKLEEDTSNIRDNNIARLAETLNRI